MKRLWHAGAALALLAGLAHAADSYTGADFRKVHKFDAHVHANSVKASRATQ